MSTKIEWADETWNPVVGCTKVSPGCQNCYAERMAWRLKAMGLSQYQNVVDESGWTGKIALAKSQMEKPLHWRKPRMIFVCSMSDLFHEEVPDQFIYRVLDVAMETSHHIYQVLTKRPVRMLEVTKDYCLDKGLQRMPDNIWGLVSAENQDAADYRIPILLRCPFSTRGVSIEPMLGPVNARDYMRGLGRYHTSSALDWVIVGGESGPDARPMNINWVRDIRDQCVKAYVPFFFKHWGEWAHVPSDTRNFPHKAEKRWFGRNLMARVGKKHAGRELDGRYWNQLPVTEELPE